MNILHITDLHFSVETPEREQREKWRHILKTLEKQIQGRKVDAVAVTGDITCHGDPAEFMQADKYLAGIAEMLSLKRKRFFFCPGNHDADTEESGSSFSRYRDFVNAFYKQTESGCQIKRKEKKTGKEQQFQFISVNTCSETSLRFYDDAVIPENFLPELRKCRKDSYGILLLHHQPEVIKNQEILMELVDSGKIRLMLCGHLHPFALRSYRIKDVSVINGMAVTPHLDWIPAGMQLIHIKREGHLSVKRIRI